MISALTILFFSRLEPVYLADTVKVKVVEFDDQWCVGRHVHATVEGGTAVFDLPPTLMANCLLISLQMLKQSESTPRYRLHTRYCCCCFFPCACVNIVIFSINIEKKINIK